MRLYNGNFYIEWNILKAIFVELEELVLNIYILLTTKSTHVELGFSF